MSSHFGVKRKVYSKESEENSEPKSAITDALIYKELMDDNEEEEEKVKEDVKELMVKINEETNKS